MISIKQLMQIGQEAAIEAGKAIMEVYCSKDFATEIKDGEFPVTRADKNAHHILTQYLKKTDVPILSEEGRNIDFHERKSWKYFWLVDPLDGTKEFINQNGEFTVNVALVERDIPIGGIIYRPTTDTLYTGSMETGIRKIENNKHIQISPLPTRRTFNELLEKDHVTVIASRSHPSPQIKSFTDRFREITIMTMGSSRKFMLLLENEADVYPRFGTTMEWDTAAAHAILNTSNRGLYHIGLKSELIYNKPDLRNPFFIAF